MTKLERSKSYHPNRTIAYPHALLCTTRTFISMFQGPSVTTIFRLRPEQEDSFMRILRYTHMHRALIKRTDEVIINRAEVQLIRDYCIV